MARETTVRADEIEKGDSIRREKRWVRVTGIRTTFDATPPYQIILERDGPDMYFNYDQPVTRRDE